MRERWSFGTASRPVLVKTRETVKSAGGSYSEKEAAAKDLRRALEVTDITQTRGARIMVYDDVCTTGHQLNAVATVLTTQGEAASVEGIVLARAPWRH